MADPSPRGIAVYLAATRQPWAGVLFAVPLLLAYEIGLHLLGSNPDDSRTGADAWTRALLVNLGLTAPFIAPLLLILGLVAWHLLSKPRSPVRDPVGVWIGMMIESAIAAGLLFGIVQLAYPLLASFGAVLDRPMNRMLETAAQRTPEWTWEMIVRYMGAGIYEETLFRLMLFSGVRFLFRLGDYSERAAAVIAAAVSAALFAAAHQIGMETINATLFLYRVLAGLYFAVLFHCRGFGVAVGTHAGYDILVGLILR